MIKNVIKKIIKDYDDDGNLIEMEVEVHPESPVIVSNGGDDESINSDSGYISGVQNS